MTNELYVTDDTTVEELKDYIEYVVANPYVESVDGVEKQVWNFSSHEINEEELNLEMKHESEFIIPFGVTTTWAMMYVMLPERLRGAENLVWNQSNGEYRAYRQFYRDFTSYEMNSFRQKMVRVLEE
jgi:hypothetical protein